MTFPRVTEITRPLEPVAPDTFIAGGGSSSATPLTLVVASPAR